MVKYFLRSSAHDTESSIVKDASNCAKAIDSHWIQTMTKFLKGNHSAYVMNCPLRINKGSFHNIFNDIYWIATSRSLDIL